jgi:hypothetical protein
MYVAFYYKKIFLTIITNCQSFVLMCGTTSNMCGFIEETVGVDCNVSSTLLMKEKKVKKIIFEKSHIA